MLWLPLLEQLLQLVQLEEWTVELLELHPVTNAAFAAAPIVLISVIEAIFIKPPWVGLLLHVGEEPLVLTYAALTLVTTLLTSLYKAWLPYEIATFITHPLFLYYMKKFLFCQISK